MSRPSSKPEIASSPAITGLLVPRSQPGSVLHDPEEAADRLLSFVDSGRMAVLGADPIPLAADSVCVHGDTPGSVAILKACREALTAALT